MNTFVKKTSLLAAAGAFLTLGSFVYVEQAQARCCLGYYDHNYNDEGNDHVISSLTERINAMELAIIESLRLGTGQVSGNLKEQIGADANLANAQDDRAVVGRVEEARLGAMADAANGASAVCFIDNQMGYAGAQTASYAYNHDLNKALHDWATGAEGMPTELGTAGAITSRIDEHCSMYANPQDIRSGLCPADTEITELVGANTRANQSLFYIQPGVTSGTLTEDRAMAANQFMLNLVNPTPRGAMLPGEASTPGGRELAARNMAEVARVSVADDAIGSILSLRTPQTPDGGQESQHVQSTRALASDIPGYNPDFSEGVSWYDMMDVRARAWFMNPDWALKTSSWGYQQTIKDNTLINSYDAYIGWETYRLLEKQTVILATMLAMMVEESRE